MIVSVAIGLIVWTQMALPAPEHDAIGPPPHGVFLLNDDNGPYPLPEWVFRDRLVTGVSIRGSWLQIEPEEGKFNWFFDKEIARAKKENIPVILRVHTHMYGRGVPGWVYTAGAKRLEFTAEGKAASAPIPWDATHLAKWKALIRAFGKKYADDDSVVLVQMAGLDLSGGEMHLVMGSRELEKGWVRLGYTKEKLIGAWTEVIDAYAEAFPHHYLGLNVSIPVYQDGVVEAVLEHAKKRLGRRLCVQHNALAGKTVEDGYPHRWVLDCKGKTIIGFQELCPLTPCGKFNDEGRRFGGSMETALDIALRADMHYLEAYPDDFQNEKLRPVLREYEAKMERREHKEIRLVKRRRHE
jgi:hypothetical protein